MKVPELDVGVRAVMGLGGACQENGQYYVTRFLEHLSPEARGPACRRFSCQRH